MDVPEDYSKPSDDFMRAVCHCGSSHINCGFCDRVHFSSGEGYDWKEGELEDLLKKAEINPDKYVNHGDESVSFGELDGIQAVYDCPCNRASQYEAFVWDNRFMIAEYFEARAKSLSRIAQEAQKIARDVSQIKNK